MGRLSKILIKSNIIVQLFSCHLVFSQDVSIQMLGKNINTNGSEFNFFRVDEKTAYFSSSTLESGNYQTAVYKTNIKDNTWQKTTYFHLTDSYNAANIQFLKEESAIYFTASEKNKNQKIYMLKQENMKTISLPKVINKEGFINTQPHITYHLKQKCMYFVSDREGGFGGLDIWVSVIDNKGNFGVPINLGPNINTKSDEITPFYNKWTNELYFSSNKSPESGFDIYKSEGKFNFWSKPIEFEQLNTKGDEVYLNFFNNKEGFFSSNLIINNECSGCNNVYSFIIKEKDTVKQTEYLYNTWLPLSLYFHNDEPDCCTMDTTTKKTYEQSLINYIKLKPKYMSYTNDQKVSDFFSETLKNNYEKLLIILDKILINLQKGKKIKIVVSSYSSPLHNDLYNINLSKRRINSLINFIKEYKSNIFSDFIYNQQLNFTLHPYGEINSDKKVSSNPNDLKNSIYSLDAILERKIEILSITIE